VISEILGEFTIHRAEIIFYNDMLWLWNVDIFDASIGSLNLTVDGSTCRGVDIKMGRAGRSGTNPALKSPKTYHHRRLFEVCCCACLRLAYMSLAYWHIIHRTIKIPYEIRIVDKKDIYSQLGGAKITTIF